MSYFDDLSVYTYDGSLNPQVLNMGWLEKGQPYPKAETSAAFHAALAALCTHQSINRYRGWHVCELCVLTSQNRPYFHEMGNGEIRVRGPNGIRYAAPRLIIHYVVEHQYCPPAEFIEAVLAHNGSDHLV